MAEKLEQKLSNELKNETPSLGDFTRKSVMGAVYRIGISFAMDAVYLTAVAAVGYSLSSFFRS